MKLHEDNAAKGDLYTTPDRPYANANPDVIKGNGKVIDLVFPIVSLIICCIRESWISYSDLCCYDCDCFSIYGTKAS